MKKLFPKEFFTLEEVARRWSEFSDCPVSIADIREQGVLGEVVLSCRIPDCFQSKEPIFGVPDLLERRQFQLFSGIVDCCDKGAFSTKEDGSGYIIKDRKSFLYIPPEQYVKLPVRPDDRLDGVSLNPGEIGLRRQELLRFEAVWLNDHGCDRKIERGSSQNENVRDHRADKLQRLIQAADRFWATADRTSSANHPTNAKVEDWLVERGFSKKLAQSGATIIRPEWAPVGRKPEE